MAEVPSPKEQVAWLKEHSSQLIDAAELEARIRKGPLNVKFGVDPTTPHLHLGHMVPVWILKKLQEWGHRITIVVGDFTAYIGDPSGRQSERPALTPAQIAANLKTYRSQVGTVLDIKSVTFKKNGAWLEKLPIRKLAEHLGKVSLASATQREDFKKRDRVTLAEVLYSTLVGIDSVVLKSDLEIGGQDQLLNFTASRELMRAEGLPPEVILTTPILRGTSNDGRKMSKSYGNAINVEDDPNDMFGKVMSVPDAYLPEYFQLATDRDPSEWRALSQFQPLEAKKKLALTIVATYHSAAAAERASKLWSATFSEHKLPTDIPTVRLTPDLKDFAALLVASKMAASRTEANRLLKDGAVEQLEGPGAPQVLTEKSPLPEYGVVSNYVLKIGKRRFLRISGVAGRIQ